MPEPLDDRTDGRTLDGKTALITGSTQGLGLAAAGRFAEAGCNIVLNGLAGAGAMDPIRKQIEDQHRVRTLFSGADLRHPAHIEEMFAAAAQAFGSVDILVNNAVVRSEAPIETLPTSNWDDSVAVNLSAAFHTIRLALPAMRRANWGRIINVSSIYGLRGAVNRVGYVTTKTALIGLTRAVALETAGQNITCNAVCPGTVHTPLHEGKSLAGKQPTGRLIEPDHVAGLMVFLCGPDGREITGAALPIDGAWSAG